MSKKIHNNRQKATPEVSTLVAYSSSMWHIKGGSLMFCKRARKRIQIPRVYMQ